MTPDGDRLILEVQRIGLRGLHRDDLHRELAARIRTAIPVDATCWHGLDPHSGLLTTADPEELLGAGFLTPASEARAAGAVIESEYGRDDYNTFTALARRRAPVGVLADATRGRPDRSARFRDFLEPVGLPHELRGTFVTGGRPYGCVVLHRTEASGPFTAEEARTLARVARPVADALRRSLRVDAARRGDTPDAPGMLLLDRADQVVMSTPAAEHLLAPLLAGAPGRVRAVPLPVIGLAARARDAARVAASTDPLTIPTGDGWVTLHASLPQGANAGQVVIVVERTAPEKAAPLRLDPFGLTQRELEVAALVLSDGSTATIARRLHLSPWTVQDHLKAVFEKTGVRSRRELRALAFVADNLQQIVERRPLDADGHLVARR